MTLPSAKTSIISVKVFKIDYVIVQIQLDADSKYELVATKTIIRLIDEFNFLT